MAVVEDGDGPCVSRYLHVVRFNVESLNDEDLSVLLITVVIRNNRMTRTEILEATKNTELPGARNLYKERYKILFAQTSIWRGG